ncbi:MAG: DUF547 domain-containing protein [Bacteroidetes bacterium]|nr:DUF547 domain-containing protein [Bacteroidota bacterium]
MKWFLFFFIIANTAFAQNSTVDYIKLSEEFLLTTKIGSPNDSFIQCLKSASMVDLNKQLNSDSVKFTFFINLYNAFTQTALQQNPDLYKSRSQFFKDKFIVIANHAFSLDDLENGFLRKSQFKYGLGYIQRWFPGKIERNWRVNSKDYRIHFALNCGAKSCPPIAFYSANSISEDLEMATVNFLNTNVVYNEQKNEVSIPMIFNWFRGDFGGKNGIRNLLKQYKLIPPKSHPKLVYQSYDWALIY